LGQTNLPMLNRVGDTIFWSSLNENLINFLKCFSESFFFQKILLNAVFSKLSFSYFYINRTLFFKKMKQSAAFYENFYKKYNLSFKFRLLSRYLSFNKKKKIYFTKVFFFSYINWIIVSVRVYNSIAKNFVKKKKKKSSMLFWKFFFISYVFKKKTYLNNKKYF
jgi:hypothetical protein